MRPAAFFMYGEDMRFTMDTHVMMTDDRLAEHFDSAYHYYYYYGGPP